MTTNIPGVELKQITQHPMGERGYWFMEQGRLSDPFFVEGVKQWSRAKMHTGCIKGFHLHLVQWDWWFVERGLIKAVVADVRQIASDSHWLMEKLASGSVHFWSLPVPETQEFFLGDDQPPAILKIPPGVAHGLKVLQGPAVLSYLTSQEYDPADEGRIPYDSLGYDWLAMDIK